MRVLHVVAPNFGHSFSGPAKIILRLLNEWCEPGINFDLWGSDFNYRGYFLGEIPLWSKPFPNNKRVRLGWTFELIWTLFRKRRHYDLVHVHTLWWGGLLVPTIAHILGKKAVYRMTLLGSDTPGAVRKEWLGWLKLALFKQYDGVIGLAPAMIEDCQQYGFQSELALLPDFALFSSAFVPDSCRREHSRYRIGIPERASVIIFVGSIVPRKGVDVLVDTFIQLGQVRPELWLLLVGANSREDNPHVDPAFVSMQREKLAKHGLQDRVIWTGLLRDEADLIETYLASDIFVFPTRAEGKPNVIFEAMACGLPVICSLLPGITDMMVTPGETGSLVKIDDRVGFAVAISELLDDPELGHLMGTAGRRRVLDDFSFNAYCEKLSAFYRCISKATTAS